MGKVLNLGEILLRVCPDTAGVWLKQNRMPFYVGGAELNVASALALWGIPSAYFTAMPVNDLTVQLVDYIETLNIDSSRIQYGGERIGLYYLHEGKDLKNSAVIYDRGNSSFATLQPEAIDWDAVFKDVSWFHFSAIGPAVSQAAADVCLEAVKAAAERNIRISIDLNYRAKLWKYGKEPIEILPDLVALCDVVMGNIWALEKMLNIPVPKELGLKDEKELYLEQAERSSKQLQQKFPKCKAVANTFRFEVGEGVKYYSTLWMDQQLQVSKEYLAEKILDKVGSGDCYMAGLIYGFYLDKPVEEVVDFATAAGFSKLFVKSDATTIKAEDVEKTVKQYEI